MKKTSWEDTRKVFLHWLSNNQLKGVLPKEIGNLINLQDLYLLNNELEGVLPKEIGNLINLKRLYLLKALCITSYFKFRAKIIT